MFLCSLKTTADEEVARFCFEVMQAQSRLDHDHVSEIVSSCHDSIAEHVWFRCLW